MRFGLASLDADEEAHPLLLVGWDGGQSCSGGEFWSGGNCTPEWWK